MDNFVQDKLKEWKLEIIVKNFNGEFIPVFSDSNLNFY